MSDRVTLALPSTNVQTRAFRSHSFNPPPTIASHRSRRTLSLPAREKPMIPPAIAEASESLRIVHDQFSSEQQPCLSGNSDDIGWFSPIVGFFLSLLLFAWACLLSLTADKQDVVLL